MRNGLSVEYKGVEVVLRAYSCVQFKDHFRAFMLNSLKHWDLLTLTADDLSSNAKTWERSLTTRAESSSGWSRAAGGVKRISSDLT